MITVFCAGVEFDGNIFGDTKGHQRLAHLPEHKYRGKVKKD